jgi:hypothetical protein
MPGERLGQPLFIRDGVTYFEDNERGIIITDHSECCIAWNEKSAEIFLASKVFQCEEVIMDYIKIIISYIAIGKGGLPIHSSAMFNGLHGALVCYCKSGGGKSTIASLLAPTWEILNDEFTLVLPKATGYSVHATPFCSPEKRPFCSDSSRMLRKIFKLEKSNSNAVFDMTLREKYLSVGQCVYALPVNKRISEQILANMQDLCSRVPIQTLAFVNDATIAKDIHHLIG